MIGASLNPQRYSFQVIKKLLAQDYKVIALGAKKGEIHGIPIHTEKMLWTQIHTISLYLSPERQSEYVDYIISLSPKRVLFNPGTENPEVEKRLDENGIDNERACSLVLLSTNQY